MRTKNLIVALAFAAVTGAMATPVLATPVNLVTNGDFALGYAGFASSYDLAASVNTDAAQYTVQTSTTPWNPWFIPSGDHTGSGNMLIGNGAMDGRVVWSSEVNVAANTEYVFEAWALNVCCLDELDRTPINPAVLSFFANGQALTTLTLGEGNVWTRVVALWNSGEAMAINLEVRNSNLGFLGNDFALDDIYLGANAFEGGSSGPLQDGAPVPEPTTAATLALGGLAALWIQRRQSRRDRH